MLNAYQAAERLGISVWALWRLVRADAIPYFRYGRGQLRFDGFELEQWKEQYRHGPRPQMASRRKRV
jgi:excisionase family DNA binding protein